MILFFLFVEQGDILSCDCKTEALFHYFLINVYVSNMFDFVAEQPYDSIPNFTAADALRLTGVGRNEFIDIMNKCRSKVVLPPMILVFYCHIHMQSCEQT